MNRLKNGVTKIVVYLTFLHLTQTFYIVYTQYSYRFTSLGESHNLHLRL
jgi:hypothetical protein